MIEDAHVTLINMTLSSSRFSISPSYEISDTSHISLPQHGCMDFKGDFEVGNSGGSLGHDNSPWSGSKSVGKGGMPAHSNNPDLGNCWWQPKSRRRVMWGLARDG
jgi:hypothetical protein